MVAVQDTDNQKQHQSPLLYNDNIMGQIVLPKKHEQKVKNTMGKMRLKHHTQHKQKETMIRILLH